MNAKIIFEKIQKVAAFLAGPLTRKLKLVN